MKMKMKSHSDRLVEQFLKSTIEDAAFHSAYEYNGKKLLEWSKKTKAGTEAAQTIERMLACHNKIFILHQAVKTKLDEAIVKNREMYKRAQKMEKELHKLRRLAAAQKAEIEHYEQQ